MAEEQAPEGIAAKLADAEALLQSAERLQEQTFSMRRELRLLLGLVPIISLVFLSFGPFLAAVLPPLREAISQRTVTLLQIVVGSAIFVVAWWLVLFPMFRRHFAELRKDQRALDELVSLLAQYERVHRLDPYRSPTMREAFRIRMSRFRIPEAPPKNVVREAEALFETASVRERSLGAGERSPEPTPSTKPAKATSG